jgi:DNA-binding SARP family transcriptional activator
MTARLEIFTFGGLAIKLDGAPITKLASRKAEALLVYVACTGKAQARESVATMLWDDRPQDRAMANLRVLLSSLRQTLGPYVAISRQSVAVNSDSPPWVDAVEFEQGLNAARKWRSRPDGLSRTEVTQLARTVDLFQGDFLQGFYPHQCRDFEEWQAAERERLRLRMIEALVELGADYLRLGEYAAGIEQARRLLQLEPLHEEAHRQLMRLYVWTDQRPAAIHQYRAWTRLLAEEMSILPSEETTALYEAIKSGSPLDPPVQDGGPGSQEAAAPRGFVSPSVHYSPVRADRLTAPFVARDDELAELSRALEAVLAEQGRVVFVTGEAGSGKTALVHEFARQAQEAVAELVAVFGRCDAHTGVGDPYLPWRDMLGLLTGDVEARWARGLVTHENASRLKALLPDVLQALFDLGPALIDTFIPRIVLAHILERMPTPSGRTMRLSA